MYRGYSRCSICLCRSDGGLLRFSADNRRVYPHEIEVSAQPRYPREVIIKRTYVKSSCWVRRLTDGIHCFHDITLRQERLEKVVSEQT